MHKRRDIIFERVNGIKNGKGVMHRNITNTV